VEDLAASGTSPYILFFFHLSALRSEWYVFSKQVGPEMNSSQLRKASTRAESLVEPMHALPKSCVLSPFEANRVSYMSACRRLQGGCIVQICHTIGVNCGQTPWHAVASFFLGIIFCSLEEDCSRAMGHHAQFPLTANLQMWTIRDSRARSHHQIPRLEILLWGGDSLISSA